MRIDFVTGLDATRLLADPAFRERWQALYQACPWATAFQSPGFVTTWYETYEGRYTPILLIAPAGDALDGLLALAMCAQSGRIEVAGSDRAEYQAWLARPRSSDLFVTRALDLFRRAYPGRTLTIQYLPTGIPLAWVTDDRRWRRLCRLDTVQTPLMSIDEGAHSSASRRKKVARSLAKLEKQAALRFERLSGVDQLESVIDEIAVQYDFRQAAVNQYVHFRDDPARKQFLLGLMRTPGLLHATVLRHGSALVSANLGLSSSDTVYLGIFAHALSYAKESPGKLQLLLLGDHLAETGYRTLDLTPGDDAYKPQFASGFADVHRLTVFPNAFRRQLAMNARRVVRWGKQGLRALGADPDAMKTQLKLIRRAGYRRFVSTSCRAVAAQVFARNELRVYAMSTARVRAQTDGSPVLRRDSLDDLLAYQAVRGLPTRDEFLSRALSRLQNGHHAYTRVEDGRLVHCGWSAERQQRAVLAEVGQSLELPPRSCVLYDFHTHPTARGRGLYQSALLHMMQDAAASGETDWIYIWVEARNTASRHVIEKAGFEYLGSAFQRIDLGHVRHWSTIGVGPARPEGGAAVAAPLSGTVL